MFEIISKFLFFFIILLGNGLIFKNYLNYKNNFNIFEFSIFGLIITGFISQFLIFFFPLKSIFLYVNFLIVFFFYIKIINIF